MEEERVEVYQKQAAELAQLLEKEKREKVEIMERLDIAETSLAMKLGEFSMLL